MNMTQMKFAEGVYFNTGGVDWQTGQPLLCLVHGASLDHTVWTLFSRYFARAGYNIMALDLPGHGKSGQAILSSIETMADWVNQQLDVAVAQSAAPSVVLAGHSMGSLVTLEAASRSPERISHLALLGIAVPMPVGDALLDAARQNSPVAREIVAHFGHAFSTHLGGNPISGISVTNAAIALMEKACDGVMNNDKLSSHNYSNGLQAAAAVTARTTLILGSEDKMTSPKSAPALRAAFGNATIDALPACGHMMMSEQPEETLQAMLRAFSG